MIPYPRIVFFGTPEFAVASLERLADSGFNVVAVVTAPDKPAGRGLKERPSPVKECALRLGLPVLQPVNMKDPAFLDELSSHRPDLQIVIAFRMMPRLVWALPPLGTFNLHASLLPQYRGAAPINHAVMNGETETGVTTFFLNDAIDTGAILLSERTPIGADETAGELYERLMNIGAGLVTETVSRIIAGDLEPVGQDQVADSGVPLKTAPKIFRDDCRIDWNRDIRSVYDHVRGLSPHPGAFTEVMTVDGQPMLLKIFRAVPEEAEMTLEPGRVLTDGRGFLKIAARNGFLRVEELQAEGRKAMNSADFLRGFGRLFAKMPVK